MPREETASNWLFPPSPVLFKPSCIELESLTDVGRHSPVLSNEYPFNNVQKFYWSSTTRRYDMNYAWVLYMVDGLLVLGINRCLNFISGR
jgi:hypothetical protein